MKTKYKRWLLRVFYCGFCSLMLSANALSSNSESLKEQTYQADSDDWNISAVYATDTSPQTQAFTVKPKMQRWTHDRFGMFIHWGLYSTRAVRAWVTDEERTAEEGYEAYYKRKYFDHFNPDLFDPKVWAKAAKYAGMKYFVITTKHHEGFCLWDSKYTDFKVTNTPYGKDLLKPMVQAFRDEGLRVGFYYSILDWHHPEFPVNTEGSLAHPMSGNAEFMEKEKDRDVKKYVEFARNQITELLTEFGPIDVFWSDIPFSDPEGEKHGEDLIKLIRELQPNILLNDRLEHLPGRADFKTPEQFIPRQWVKENGQPVPWETCMTASGFWSYYPSLTDYKSPEQLIRGLVDIVSKGGNLLLNIGPNGRGEFDPRSMKILEGIGDWMHLNSRSIYGCTQAPKEFKAPQDCRYTYNPETNRLYVHLFSWPIHELHLEGLADKVEYAQFLHDASEVQLGSPMFWYFIWEQRPDDLLTIALPTEKPDAAVPVIEIFLK